MCEKTSEIRRVPSLTEESFKFQGRINLRHLTNECMRDNVAGFVAIGPEMTHVGIMCGVRCPDVPAIFLPQLPLYTAGMFAIYAVKKSLTYVAIDFVRDVVTTHRKTANKLARTVKKENCSNKPATKVMVFR